jgi:Na+:H+ antiporter, NhaA family
VLWYFVHEFGVHATITGVFLAFTIPTHTRINAAEFSREGRALLDQFDRTETDDLLVLTSVRIAGPFLHREIMLGVLAGLIIGKPLGITVAAFVTVKSGIARLPGGVRWSSMLGYAWLGGIGFTMSLFIAMLAFDDAAPVDAAKLGILAGSLVAGVIAAVILKTIGRGKFNHGLQE